MTAAKGPKSQEYWAETVAGVDAGHRHETIVSWAGKLVRMGICDADAFDFLTWLDSRCNPPKNDPTELERALKFALQRELGRARK